MCHCVLLRHRHNSPLPLCSQSDTLPSLFPAYPPLRQDSCLYHHHHHHHNHDRDNHHSLLWHWHHHHHRQARCQFCPLLCLCHLLPPAPSVPTLRSSYFFASLTIIINNHFSPFVSLTGLMDFVPDTIHLQSN